MSENNSNAIPASLPLRNDLIGEEPYGAPQLDVPVCLNVNENPYAPDPAVCDTIARRVREIAPTLNRYPDREHIELRQAFSDYLARESGTRLDVDELWGANGSNEIMLQLFQAFGGPGRTALGADPTYSMYPEYARDTFTGWKLAHRNADFTLNVDRVIEAIAEVKPSMVLLTSPNNPTGQVINPEDLKSVLEMTRERAEDLVDDRVLDGQHQLLGLGTQGRAFFVKLVQLAAQAVIVGLGGLVLALLVAQRVVGAADGIDPECDLQRLALLAQFQKLLGLLAVAFQGADALFQLTQNVPQAL